MLSGTALQNLKISLAWTFVKLTEHNAALMSAFDTKLPICSITCLSRSDLVQ